MNFSTNPRNPTQRTRAPGCSAGAEKLNMNVVMSRENCLAMVRTVATRGACGVLITAMEAL
jgi:hypothetical protein